MTSPSPTAHLSAADSLLWEIERDPILRSPILVVAVLDREPDPDRVTAAFLRAVATVPRLRQRIRRSRRRAGLVWEDDPSFSLRQHLRRVRAPHPADLRTVLDLAQPILSTDFDRHRALWEAQLVEGVEGGRAALVMKVHHAATDGVGAVQLASNLFDLSADARPVEAEAATAVSAPLLHHLAGRARGAAAQSVDTARSAMHAARDPIAFGRGVVDATGTVARLLAPARSPLSPVMRGRSLGRHLDVVDVPMDDLARAAHEAGGTVNDVYLAAVAHGIARYHERFDEPIPAVRVTMPINLRREGDPSGGNRFAPVRFEIPLDIGDPAARIRTLGEIAHRWRDDPTIAFSDAIASGIGLLPPGLAAAVLGGLFKAVDVDAVNVQGFPVPVWLAGAEVQRLYAFAPPTGAAMSITLLSHLDTACIGIQTDDAAVSDPAAMTACLVEGLDEVISVGAAHARREKGPPQ